MMTYHFYFKNSEPGYETEYMQSLKQFAVQEVFPAYALKEYNHEMYHVIFTDAFPRMPLKSIIMRCIM